jgi:hypothetical protein
MITVEQAGFLSNFINSAPFLSACPAVPDLAATLVLAMILKFYAIGCKMLTVRIHMEICAPYPPGQHQGISICQKRLPSSHPGIALHRGPTATRVLARPHMAARTV